MFGEAKYESLKLMMAVGFLGIILALAYTNSNAETRNSTPECPLVQQATLRIEVQSRNNNIESISSFMEMKIKEIEEYAAKQQLDNFTMTSMNYNIQSDRRYVDSEKLWQTSGSVSYDLSPVDKAKALMVILASKGMQPYLSVSTRGGRACNR